MEITDLSRSAASEHLLDIKAKTTRGEINAIAICEHCSTKRDTNKKPFVRYTFRDVMGRRISGRQFDIENFSETVNSIKNMQDRVVLINGKLDYFGTVYIKVTKCEPVQRIVDETIRDKFFIKPIANWETEKKILMKVSDEILSDDIKNLFKELSVEFTLENSFNMDISDGLKGSSVMLVNTFNNTLAQLTGKSGKLLMASNMIIEAILTKSMYDPAAAIKELSEMQAIILQNITVDRRRILDIAKSSIYMYFDFEQSVYSADALLINTVREFVMKATEQKENITDSDGIFSYAGYTLSKGEI